MTVIDDIVSSASGAVPLADVLRKCLVLAFNLKNSPFQAWVDRELDGYPTDAELPVYRSISTVVKADAINTAYRWTGVTVPQASVPDQLRGQLTRVDLYQSVGELEEIVRSGQSKGEASLRVNIDPSYWPLIHFSENFNTTDMWQELAVHQISAVLEAVRNGALRFALELEQLEKGGSHASEATTDRITNIFQTAIFGGVVSVAGSAEQVTQIGEINVREGDLDGLLEYLRRIGVDDGDLRDLREAIAEDADAEPGTPGAKVWSWLKRAGGKLTGTAGQVGVTAVGQLATAAVLRYFGMS